MCVCLCVQSEVRGAEGDSGDTGVLQSGGQGHCSWVSVCVCVPWYRVHYILKGTVWSKLSVFGFTA